MVNLCIECENICDNFRADNNFVIENAKNIFNFYMSCPEIRDNCCLNGYEYKSVSFDFLLCSSEKTHEINKEYRNKDYPADIITFAIFADSDSSERFICDFDINLGEIIISLDKMQQESKEKGVSFETELLFFVSHGILHLLGFDHQSEEEFDFVIKYQKKALESLNIIYDKI